MLKLQIEHLTKSYRDKQAVADVSLCLTPGVWGLLGANGAGKTTLMRMLVGLLPPTSGTVLCDGLPIRSLKEQYRDLLGYLPQEFGFYPEFNVQDYLAYLAALKGLPKQQAKLKIDELLEQMSLTEVRKKKIAKLSGGMKRRVGIAQALLNDPQLLILDEPTSGLDPAERIRFRNLLSDYAIDRIVLISTHIVSDVEYIAEHNAIMKDGRIIATGSTEELLRLIDGQVWLCRLPAQDIHRWEQRLQVVNLRHAEDGSVQVRYLAPQALTADSQPAVPRLEDLYLSLFPQEGGQA